MFEREIQLSPAVDARRLIRIIERHCLTAGLRIALKGTLAKYLGCIHWHFKRGREVGTLEITVWPIGRRAWCSVQSGRRSAWIDADLPRIVRSIEADLQQSSRRSP
jgi:hypothetical protein